MMSRYKAIVASVGVAAAVVLLFRYRRKRAQLLPPTTRIFLVRHAEREDHARPAWAAHASRPHDSPLSEEGFDQARCTGEYLRGLTEGQTLYVRCSPLVRTVQTAACLTAAMGVPTLPIQADDALCEKERHLRPRMMGTHKHSVQPGDRTAVAPTCDAPRGVCQPVLLRPGDLMSIHRYMDLSYRGEVCPVEFDLASGAELNARTRQPQSSEERAQHVAGGIARLAPVGATTVLVTHGAFARLLGEQLLGVHLPADWANFGYGEVAQLCATNDDCAPGNWRVVGERFAPAGDAGRSCQA